MAGSIVVFGATGYTGELVARALVERGARPVLAARSAQRLNALATELGGLPVRVADVSAPETVRALVQRGDVLISTVGPFTRFGTPAIEAAIAAGATYLDSTGEPSFIRRVFDHYGPAARASGTALLTAFGYDWVPGNLAAALALRDAGAEATRVQVGYFSQNSGGISGGTRASMFGAIVEPSFAYRRGKVVVERGTAHARRFELSAGDLRESASVGGTEHFVLSRVFPNLRDVDVFIGMAGAGRLPILSSVIGGVTLIPGVRKGLGKLNARFVPGSTGGPNKEARDRSSSVVLAEAFSQSRKLLSRVRLDGINGYTFTANILAWAAMEAVEQRVVGTGALGPVDAFGIDRLQAAVDEAGLHRT